MVYLLANNISFGLQLRGTIVLRRLHGPHCCPGCGHLSVLYPVGVRVDKSASELFWIVSVEARQAATTLAVLQTSDGSRMRERLHGAVDRAAHEFCKRNARLINFKTIALLWSVDSGLHSV